MITNHLLDHFLGPLKAQQGLGVGVLWSVVSTHRDTQALSTDQLKQSSRCSDCSGGRSTNTRFLVASPKIYHTSNVLKLRLTRARASVSSVCDLALRKVPAIVIIQPISLLNTTAVNA